MQELFRLTQHETGILSQDAYPDMSATYPLYTELYRYQVPVDKRIIFKPGHTFSIYARKTVDQYLDGAIADDGGAYVGETWEANEATINDLQLAPAAPVAGDAYYFGYRYPFSGITVKYSTAATAGTIAWEYWSGAAFAALSDVTDGTAHWITGAGTHDVTWTLPVLWEASGAGDSGDVYPTMFWVRARCIGANDVCTGDQVWVHPDPTVIENTDRIRIEVRDQNELIRKPLINGAQYRQVTEFTDRDLIYRLELAQEVVAGPGNWIIIAVKSLAPVDVSACYFNLTCDRERLGLF